MKNFRLLSLTCIMAVLGCGSADRMAMVEGSKLQPCDLLFVATRSGNAITAVTRGWHSRPIDHVAMVVATSPEITVCEAVPQYGVRTVGLATFLNTANSDCNVAEILVGRVTVPLSKDSIMAHIEPLMALPYDSLYMPDSRAIYCSELIEKTFVDLQGRKIFETIPMNFLDSEGRVPQRFADFYRSHGMEVPQGLPGTNPGQLSRSQKVAIVGSLPINITKTARNRIIK